MAASDAVAPKRASRIREIVTPEGVALRVTLASRGERFLAVLIDIAIIVAILIVTVIGCLAALSSIGANWAFSLGIVLSFGIRSFYFVFFELRWQGVTPGKWMLKLRVIDRGGRRLRPNAVFARNLMREVELFMPLSLMFVAGSSATAFLTLLWTGTLMAVPMFNRDRLRCGDIVAGTWVVETPKTALLPDIAETGADERPVDAIRFTREQLSHYGIYELQTLEDVLRQESGPTAAETRATVARTIQAKTGWQAPGGVPVDDSAFLRAFYAAQRNHLEQSALFGRRRANKFDRD